MIRRADIVRYASGSVVCFSVVLAACAARPAGVSAQSSAVDSVAVQLATLELQRISLRASGDDSSTTKIDSQIRSLGDRLRRPADDSTRGIAIARVLLALDARKATVNARLGQMRLMYTDRYPPVRRAIEESRLIDQRRDEIRAGRF